MINLKKLTFAPLFLIGFAYLCFQTNIFLNSTDSLFSLSLEAFLQPLFLALIILLTSFLFILFATLAQDWILVGVTSLAAGILPIIFLPSPFSLYFAIGTVIVLVINYAVLLNKLKTYLNFQPSVLLSPSIRNLATLLVLIISIIYFQNLSTTISQKGFQVPDSLINTITQLSDTSDLDALTNPRTTPRPSLPPLSKEDLQFLKNNPQLLTERGLDPSLINDFEAAQNGNQSNTENPVKNLIKNQIQNEIKPYESFIAPTLAILTFFTLSSFISLLSFLNPILLSLVFLILRSTGFVKFTTEMREVKKLVV